MARAGLIRGGAVAVALCASACAQTNLPEDAPASADARVPEPVDAFRGCSRLRSATIVVVVNVDGINDYAPLREALVVGLIERLLDGDLDDDGSSEARPLDRVRLAVVSNEMGDDRFVPMGGCGEPSHGEFIESACGTGGNMQTILAADPAWREEAACRMRDVRGDGLRCVGEPLEAALVALSPDPPPVDVSPRTPLGDTANRAWREVEDVLVVVLESADLRDDCSRRTEEIAVASGTCPPDDPYCCPANLPPVSRTSEGLRAIVGDRPAIFASFGAHGAFDPRMDEVNRLEELERVPECYLSRPHTRMVQLAGDLYPDMHLLPVECMFGVPESAGLAGLAAHILGEVCE